MNETNQVFSAGEEGEEEEEEEDVDLRSTN